MRGRGSQEIKTRSIGVYSHENAYEDSKSFEVTPGAVRIEMLPVSKLKEDLKTGDTLVLGDVHSQIDRLRNTLFAAGLIDTKGNRLRDDVTLISIGDLIDGRDEKDMETLATAQEWLDKILMGNHEAVYYGGTDMAYREGLPFTGWVPKPEIQNGLSSLMWSGKLDIAHVVDDILITHAGVTPQTYAERDPKKLAEQIEADWLSWMQNPTTEAHTLHAKSPRRGGKVLDRPAGVLWSEWDELVQDHPTEFRQMVGHSPRGGAENSEDGNLFNIDLAGAHQGIARISDGKVIMYSDRS